MKNFKNKKTLQIVLLVVIAVVTLGIGYAAISAVNLIINGNATASVNQNNFKVHFTQAQSITGSTGVSGTSTIDSQDDTKATFDVTGLTKVGDYAEAVYTVRNDSNGIGAEITLNLESSNTEYFKVTETILDNKLQTGEETTAKVRVEMIKTPITDSISTSITAILTASPLEDTGAAGGSPASKVAGDPESFSTDSWATIQKAVQNNNTSAYNVGDTKTVTINGNNYIVRIANKTTHDWCDDESYSQTACGFVVEFAEIVESRAMNTEQTNIGGWPGSELHAYLNETFYNNLPNDLKAVIEPTRVISGYGNNGIDSSNFITADNLYLLSGVEVFGSDDYDTAASTTIQLDYYLGMEKTQTDIPYSHEAYFRTYKGYNGNDGSTSAWWLRPAIPTINSFSYVSCGTFQRYADSSSFFGLAPAFRIG